MSDTVSVIEVLETVEVVAGDTITVNETLQTVEVVDGDTVIINEVLETVAVQAGDTLVVQEVLETVEVGGADHPSRHDIGGHDHNLSGLTPGDVLTAIDPTSAAFAPPTGGGGGPHEFSGSGHVLTTLTPPSISGAINDYNPAGLATASVLRLTCTDATTVFTGIVSAGGVSKVLVLHNVGLFAFALLSDDGESSSPENRLLLDRNNLKIEPSTSAIIEYDGTSQRWRVVSIRYPGGHPLDGETHSGPISVGQHGAMAGPANAHRWPDIDKTTSSLADITTRPHSALTGAGANDHHNQSHALDSGDHSGVISATQHGTPAGDLHTGYFKADGTRDITGAFDIEKASGVLFTGTVTGEANPRLRAQHDRIELGAGGANALDMAIIRHTTAGTIRFQRLLTATAPTLEGLGSTATQPHWRVSGGSGFQQGPGGSTALDTSFGRIAAKVWKLTDTLEFAQRADNPGVASVGNQRLFLKPDSILAPRFFSIDESGRVFGPYGMVKGLFSSGGGLAMLGGFSVSRRTTDIDTWGAMAGHTKVIGAGAEATEYETQCHMAGYKQTTPATANTNVGFEWPIRTPLEAVMLLSYLFDIDSVADIRVFVGYTTESLATMLGSDNPAGSYVGLQFSGTNLRGDTNLQFVTKDGTTQTVTDSGVAATTVVNGFRLDASMGSCIAEVFDYAWTPLAAPVALTATLPSGLTDLRLVAGMRTTAATAKALRHFAGAEVVGPG